MTKKKSARAMMRKDYPDEVFRMEFEGAVEVLLPEIGDESMYPRLLTVLIDPKTGEIGRQMFVMNPAGYDNWSIRSAAMEALGTKLGRERLHVVCMFFGSEAWVVERVMNPDKRNHYSSRQGRTILPSEEPDRKEAATVQGSTIDGRTGLMSAYINRDSNGNIGSLGEHVFKLSIDGDWEAIEKSLMDCFWRGYALGFKGIL